MMILHDNGLLSKRGDSSPRVSRPGMHWIRPPTGMTCPGPCHTVDSGTGAPLADPRHSGPSRRRLGVRASHCISKPGCYYVTLFLFRYIISIMTLLCPIMTLLYHLFFCKCPDYYFSLFHYLQKDYYFTYDTSIISLIFFVINYCY